MKMEDETRSMGEGAPRITGQYSLMVKNRPSGVRMSGSRSQFTSCVSLVNLSLRFHICKMGITTIPAHRGLSEIK